MFFRSRTDRLFLFIYMNTYSDKLRNPLWQKKRLEILSRDNFTCMLCGDTQVELHIHHKEYEYGKDPWEYANENFITYCKHCHLVEEFYKHQDYKPLIVSKRYIAEFERYLIICIVYNSKISGLGVSIKYITSLNMLESKIDISSDTILSISNLLEISKKLI